MATEFDRDRFLLNLGRSPGIDTEAAADEYGQHFLSFNEDEWKNIKLLHKDEPRVAETKLKNRSVTVAKAIYNTIENELVKNRKKRFDQIRTFNQALDAQLDGKFPGIARLVDAVYRYRDSQVSVVNQTLPKPIQDVAADSAIVVPPKNETVTCPIPTQDDTVAETIQKEETPSAAKQQVSTEELERRAVTCYNQKSHMTSVPYSQISQYKTEDDIPEEHGNAYFEAYKTYTEKQRDLKISFYDKEITNEEHSRLQRQAADKLTNFKKTSIYFAWLQWQDCRQITGLANTNNPVNASPTDNRSENLSQSIAENTSKGGKVSTTTDGVTKVSSLAVASKGTGSTCTDKLKSLADDIKDLSPADLAKKLGVAIEDLLENGVNEIKEFFGEVDPDEIEDKLKDLFKNNIIYDALGDIKDIGTSIIDGLSAGGSYIESRIKKGIDSLKKTSFKELLTDLIALPFKATFSIIGGIANQLNKTLCNGNLLENVSDLLGDIDSGVDFFNNLLSNKDLGALLAGALDSELLAKLLKVGIIAATLKDRLSDDILRDQLYVNAPTTLTTDRPGLSALLATTVSPNLDGNSNQGGLWDPEDVPSLPVLGFTLTDSFNVNATGFNNISDDQVKVLLTDKYDQLYTSLDFDFPVSSQPQDITLQSGNLSEGDVLFSIGITGDNSFGESDNIFTSILTLTYVIHKRVNTTDDICKQKLVTKSVTYGNVPFYGIGDSIKDSRDNAFAECKNKVINDINKVKEEVLNFK